MSRRILGNFGKVLRGRGIGAVLSVIATGLMANALPVDQFGLVILLHTYVLVIKGLLNFRSFEAIVRFGVPLNDQGDESGLRSLLRSTVMIDVTASAAATLIALAAIPLAAWMLHWDSQMVSWAAWYCLVLLTTPTHTGSGILRIYDRFDVLGVQYTVGPAVRFVLVGAAWLMDAGMELFILAWAIAYSIGNVYMILRGFREFRVRSAVPLWQGFSRRDVLDRGSEFWRFLGVVYWQTNVDLLPKHLSTLLAGYLLGPAAAGLFRLAREISSVLAQPAVILRDVMFPDLTRAWHINQQGFSKLPFRAAWIAGLAGLVVVGIALLIGQPLLGLIGEDYVTAQPLMILLLAAAALELASASLRAAAYAMGRAGGLLNIHLLGVTVYLVSFYLLTLLLGIIGPGIASIVASVLTLALTIRLVARLR